MVRRQLDHYNLGMIISVGYEHYRQRQIEDQARLGSDFDRMAKQLTDGKRGKEKP